MNSIYAKYPRVVLATLLMFTLRGFGQPTPERPNYPDEIFPVRGRPFKGKILKFEGGTLYVEVTRHKIIQILRINVDSLIDVKKDFGPTKVSIFRRQTEPTMIRRNQKQPVLRIPKHLGSPTRKDTLAALAVERDSIFVGAIDRKDTTTGTGVMVDQKPVPLSRANTEYPREAVAKRKEGIVRLRLWIDKDGIPRKHEVLESTDPVFIDESVRSAMKWEFSPAVVRGTPVGVWASITFEFRFQK